MTYFSNNISSKIIGQQLRVKLNDENIFVLNKPSKERYQLILDKNDGGKTILWMRQSCNGFARLFETTDTELAQRIMDITVDALSEMASFEEKTKYIQLQESLLPSKGFLLATSAILSIILALVLLNSSPHSTTSSQWIPVQTEQSSLPLKQLASPMLSIPPDDANKDDTPFRQQRLLPDTDAPTRQINTPLVQSSQTLTPQVAAEARTLLAERLKTGAAKQEFTVQLSSGHPRTLYFFLDPQCPNCRIFEPTVRALSAQYNVEIFPVTLLGKARTAEDVVPVLCAPPQSRAERWYRLFDLGDGMLNPGANDAPQPASCEAGQNALARNDMAFELYRFPGTPTVISDDGRMIPLQAMTSDSTLQAFLNTAQ